MKKFWKVKSALALTGILLFGSSLTALAEEGIPEDAVTPAGYHVYDVQENAVSDEWYAIARGDHLQAGISKLLEKDKNHVVCSGTTFAHGPRDRVYVAIYLDQSDTAASGSWGTIDYWTGEAFGKSTVTIDSGSYRVPRGKYYSVKGAHSATQDGYTEATTTCTNALYLN